MVFHESLAVLTTYSAWGWLALRLMLASVFIYHGLPKLTKSKTMAQGMGKPQWFIIALGSVEVLSSLSVLTGFYYQLGALGMMAVMLGAIYYKMFKWKVPFSAMDKTGWEFDVALLAAAILVLTSASIGLTL